MTEPARIRPAFELGALPAEIVLGPATVVRDGHPFAVVRIAGESDDRRARVALAVPYHAAEGDEVLVIGSRQGGDVYVVGVLAGAGRVELEVPGDVTVRAVGGTLRLEGDRGVEVRGDEVRVEGRALTWLASKVIQKSDELVQRVRGLLSTHAERQQTTIDESSTTTARTSTLLVSETATINGKQIHLG